MDRQDLKEGQEVYGKGRVIHTGDHLDIVLDKGSFIENAIILHHEKPVIPQFVADWIEVCKAHLTTNLYTAMNPNFMKENDQSFDFILWIKKTSNQETFARAWLDGYDVEPEKRYVVTDGNHLYLKEYKDVGIIAISNKISESTRYIKKFENKDEAQKIADVLKWKVQEVE